MSVYAALDQEVEVLCRQEDPLTRPAQIRTALCGVLRSAGFPLLATFKSPHYSIVLADLETPTLDRLDDCFSPPWPNPARG